MGNRGQKKIRGGQYNVNISHQKNGIVFVHGHHFCNVVLVSLNRFFFCVEEVSRRVRLRPFRRPTDWTPAPFTCRRDADGKLCTFLAFFVVFSGLFWSYIVQQLITVGCLNEIVVSQKFESKFFEFFFFSDLLDGPRHLDCSLFEAVGIPAETGRECFQRHWDDILE